MFISPRKLPVLPALALALAAAACGGGEAPGGTSPGAARRESPAAPTDQARDRLEHLQALPYVQLDPDADTTLRGVTTLEAGKAYPGYNLYTDDVNKVYLTDLTGRLVHQWQVPPAYQRCEYAELLDDGSVLVVCVDQGLLHMDWGSRVLWELKMKVHHDVTLRPDGTILVPYHTQQPYRGRQVWFDYLLSLSMEGRILGRWSTLEHLDELKKHHGPSPLDTPPGPGPDPLLRSPTGVDYYHLNTVEVLPDTPLGREDPRFRAGNILISLRNADVIMILDRESYHVEWSWGRDELDLQHMPTMLETGNILVFDNGTYRNWSRVVELEPATGKIVWEYRGDPPESFYSKWRGSNQRFPNGNTLICESERGHAFEITPEGEVVWEFWNPELYGTNRRRIYRLLRVPVEKVAPYLPAGAGS